MSEKAPKLFVSYSHTSPEREEWVLNFATELVQSGVDVVLDKWDLKEGHDAYAFMEKMVTDPEIERVVLVCDRRYAEKADDRSGGVGVETQIISPEIYAKQDQNKFVAVVVEHDDQGKACLPAYYKSRIYIDFTETEEFATKFEQLLRWIFNKPVYEKPPVGTKPAYLTDDSILSLETTPKYRRALEAVRNNRPHRVGALTEYFEIFAQSLERFRIKRSDKPFDQEVVKSIESFLPYRHEAIDLFIALAQYCDAEETWAQLHKFFEDLIPYFFKPPHVTHWGQDDFDNFRFIVHELFIYGVAVLLKYERFFGVKLLLQNPFYVAENLSLGRDPAESFSVFSQPAASLVTDGRGIGQWQATWRGELLKERSGASGVPFRFFIQADFLLLLRDKLNCLRSGERPCWRCNTLVYLQGHYGPLEIFAKSKSASYFNRIKPLLGISAKDELESVIQAFSSDRFDGQNFSYELPKLLAYDSLETIP